MLIPAASTSAEKVDSVFYSILGIEVVLLVMVTSVMISFVLLYRRKKKAVADTIEGSIFLEIVWTIIPTLLVLVMFYVGWKSFSAIRAVPEEVMVVKVMARQWSWLFTYDNGKQSDVLRLPVNKPIKLLLTSRDIIHCLYIPAFRIKEDCVPNMETYLSLTADRPGTYDVFCTEYCGLGHSGMVSKVMVMEKGEFAAWYAAAPVAGRKTGAKVLAEKGCLGCHSVDGTQKIGPTFKGLYNERVTVFTEGRENVLTASEDYLRRSIRDPKADIVKGYPNIMPVIPLTPEELDAVVTYIETLR